MTSAKTRHASKDDVIKTLGIARDQLASFMAAGLPHDTEPWKGRTAYRFNYAEVHRWIVQYERERLSVTNLKTFKDERERLAAAQAEKTELQVEQLRGTLVPIDAVERGWATTWSNVRDLLRAVPMSAVDRCLAAAEDGKTSLKATLQAEIDDALDRASRIEVVIQPDADEDDEAA